MKKKSIASIVLNNFKNDSRVLKEATTLQNNNYDVTVVALHEEPLKNFEQIESFKVHRMKLTSRSWSKNKAVQLLKYVEFIFRVVKTYRYHNIIHCHDLNALPVGVIIKLFLNKKAKVVYDAHEYETETNGLKGISKLASKVLERTLIKKADAVITVSESIANEYVRLYKIKKPALVLNTPPFKEIIKKDLFREKLQIRSDQNIFLYQGALTKGRGIEILLDAFSQLVTDKNVIVFMGYGPFEEEIKKIGKLEPTVYFKSAVSPSIVLDYTSSADYGISFIEDLCLSYRYCLPNKMFEYIMSGVPVICSNLPEMRNIVEKYQLGVVAETTTKEGIISAIREIITYSSSLDENNTARKEFCWESQEKQLLRLYKNLPI